MSEFACRRGDASLIHTDIEGSQDIEPSAQVRIYHYAGTQHGSATWPLTDSNPLDGSRAQCGGSGFLDSGIS